MIVSILGGTVSILTVIGLFVGAFMYIKATAGAKGASIDADTIKQLNNSIEALERENKRLTQENTVKDQRLASMQLQIDQSKEQILKLSAMVANLAATPVAPVAPVAPVLPIAPLAPNPNIQIILDELKDLKAQLERKHR